MKRYILTILSIACGCLAASALSTAVTDTLHEVTVTAIQPAGATSTSRIGREAMRHLQPTSFADLMALLPGGMSKTPDMTSVNSINLRETGTIGALGTSVRNADYDISSLGTLFVIDGAPVSTDANMQMVGNANGSSSLNSTNRGVDMRSIATDNIESVEIVRGIAPVEYGNFSSGMVNIRRTRRAIPFTARFKADEYSKLFFAGKGFAVDNTIVNADIGWLDSKADPRDNLNNYTRINASVRSQMRWSDGPTISTLNLSVDYTGSTDKSKIDPDISNHKIDEYRASYNSMGITADYRLLLPFLKAINAISLIGSLTYQSDRLHRLRQVAPGRATVAPTSMEEGVHDGRYILDEYVADYLADGRPLSAFLKFKASGNVSHDFIRHDYMAGGEWNMAKNYGHGQVYDIEHPLSAAWTARPRDYSQIPAIHNLSFFVEDDIRLSGLAGRLRLQAGMRAVMLAHLDSRYLLSGKPYLDPRLNAVWDLPLAGQLKPLIAIGWGISTRMPTVDYLYPQAAYVDFVQLNYYDVNNPMEHSRVNLSTYINDPTNHELKPARNKKWEVRLGASVGTNRLSVTYFNEHLRSGYRYEYVYRPYQYRRYDASAIDGTVLQGPPDLGSLPYEDRNILGGYSKVTNGSRIDKQGVEFQINTARWRPIATALTITGAWFRSTYSNSMRLQRPVGDVVSGTAVSDRFVGIYDTDEGRVNEQFNTNFMFDTQISRLGLIFSTTVECMWRTSTEELPDNHTPSAYIDVRDGKEHPYTEEAVAAEPLLRFLSKQNTSSQKLTVPLAMYVNLKATKEIGRYMRIALFVNRILDCLPDYTSNGLLVRRSSGLYFGMELNFTI
ncbi:MAG: TonB-dependent receptor plug domain-containing protein [Muribaculaceae bacterium]|nr:TonB-dependent receptor plug domain-containing protein [Muribaculaceae bacterium]